MTEAEIELCRLNLLKLRSELAALEASSGVEITPPIPDLATGDSLSRRDAMQKQIVAGERGRQRKRQIQKIDGALRRIQSGQFGRCFVCEEELDATRLTEDPTITRCVNCIEP